jgi:hypothetical protein
MTGFVNMPSFIISKVLYAAAVSLPGSAGVLTTGHDGFQECTSIYSNEWFDGLSLYDSARAIRRWQLLRKMSDQWKLMLQYHNRKKSLIEDNTISSTQFLVCI